MDRKKTFWKKKKRKIFMTMQHVVSLKAFKLLDCLVKCKYAIVKSILHPVILPTKSSKQSQVPEDVHVPFKHSCPGSKTPYTKLYISNQDKLIVLSLIKRKIN